MTNHIEQMMKTAEVKPEPIYSEVWADEQVGVYIPAFTAEKQPEIIKLIIETQGFCGFTNFRDNDKYSISCGFNFPVGPNPAMGINFNPTFRKCETLEQALAQLTTELMNAGELDKEKVKEILEC